MEPDQQMNKILIKWPKLTTAQVILFLVLFIAIWQAFLTLDIQYNRQVNYGNQQSLVEQAKETREILDKQGNLSAHSRQVLINQFSSVAQHGGFATNERQISNNNFLRHIDSQLNQTVVKLDKLLNQTSLHR